MTLKEMITELARLDRVYDAASRAQAAAKTERDAYEYQVHDRMEDEGFDVGDDIKHQGTRWGRQVDWYAKVQDPILFKEWAAEHAPHLIQPSPQKKALNELVQAAHDDGTELPPGIAEQPKVWVSRRSA